MVFDVNARAVYHAPTPTTRLPRRRLGQLSLAAWLAGTGRAAADCLPGGVTVPQPPTAAAADAVRAPAISVFIDVSGSMAGFVDRPHPAAHGPGAQGMGEPRAFRDVVLSLPELGAAVADQVQLFAFGSSIRPLPLAELPRATDPHFYADQDSRIQAALARMDALPEDQVSLLLTDLFLTGAEVFGGAAAIRQPLAHMLDSGRSVALAGIRSGFAGTVYDIPGVKPYREAAERPFYLLGCGPAPALATLLQRLQTELLAPLPPPADGEPRSHAVLFTHDPLRPGVLPLTLRPGGGAEPAPRLAEPVGVGAAGVRFPGGAGSAGAALGLAALANGPALLPDQFSVAGQLWAQPPGASACAPWVAIHSLPPLAQIAQAADGAPLLRVGGAELARVTPGLLFLLQARVATAGLSDMPAQTAWVRAWNLEAREAEDYVASRPRMFRTLNLREIVSMLEGIVRDRLTPRPVAEALLALEVSPPGAPR